MKTADIIMMEVNNTTYFKHDIPLFLNVNSNAAKYSLTTHVMIDDIECTTGDVLLDCGMGVCNYCGNIVSIDDNQCSSCCDDIFVVRHSSRR